jgi:hypothetical protein
VLAFPKIEDHILNSFSGWRCGSRYTVSANKSETLSSNTSTAGKKKEEKEKEDSFLTVVPATQEPEAGGSLKLMSSRPAWAT